MIEWTPAATPPEEGRLCLAYIPGKAVPLEITWRKGGEWMVGVFWRDKITLWAYVELPEDKYDYKRPEPSCEH